MLKEVEIVLLVITEYIGFSVVILSVLFLLLILFERVIERIKGYKYLWWYIVLSKGEKMDGEKWVDRLEKQIEEHKRVHRK